MARRTNTNLYPGTLGHLGQRKPYAGPAEMPQANARRVCHWSISSSSADMSQPRDPHVINCIVPPAPLMMDLEHAMYSVPTYLLSSRRSVCCVGMKTTPEMPTMIDLEKMEGTRLALYVAAQAGLEINFT